MIVFLCKGKGSVLTGIIGLSEGIIYKFILGRFLFLREKRNSLLLALGENIRDKNGCRRD